MAPKRIISTRKVERIFKNQKRVVYLGVVITEGVSNYYSKFTTGLHHINFKGFENSIYYFNKIDWKLKWTIVCFSLLSRFLYFICRGVALFSKDLTEFKCIASITGARTGVPNCFVLYRNTISVKSDLFVARYYFSKENSQISIVKNIVK